MTIEERANEYTPWVELGMSELEYWKMRYLEERRSGLDAIMEFLRGDDASGVRYGKHGGCKESATMMADLIEAEFRGGI